MAGLTLAWTALLVCVLALGVAVWVSTRRASVFDVRELSGFPSGLVVPVRESVNRTASLAGSALTREYNKDKTKYDGKLVEGIRSWEESANYVLLFSLGYFFNGWP
jgi:hypothetical protein